MDNIRTHIARHLLSIGAVFLRPDEPFVWASGIKSPIYCDNRLILTAPEARNEVEQAIADTVRREYPEAQVLMGTATAGIAHAAIAAHLLGLPMGYVRSGNKDHGRKNRIEGRLDRGEKVVVIEDLISTGGSVIDTVDALREAGAEVLGVVSITTAIKLAASTAISSKRRIVTSLLCYHGGEGRTALHVLRYRTADYLVIAGFVLLVAGIIALKKCGL